MRKFLTALAMCFAFFCNGQQSFEFTSDGVKQQSAGVFDEEGKLVRTLFTGKKFPAGTTSYSWDGKDDLGKIVGQGKYSVHLLSHDLKAEWEGTALNTSSQVSNTVWGESNRHFGYYGAAIDIYEHPTSKWVYYCTGYAENNITLRKFNVDNPDAAVYLKKNATTLYAEEKGAGLTAVGSVYNICSDGQTLYASALTNQAQSYMHKNDNAIWIMAFDINPTSPTFDQMKTFSAGKALNPGGNYPYPSAILLQEHLGDNVSAFDYMVTGLAVNGTYLYAAQRYQNKISVFNKSTGALVMSTNGIANPRRMAADGNYLWVIYGQNQVGKFALNSAGNINAAPVSTLAGLSDPHSLSIQTLNGIQYIYVTDGGVNQVVRRYKASDGSLDNSFNGGQGYFGQVGGYTNNSIVSDDRFYFTKNQDKCAGISVKSDGSFWLCDDGNNRVHKYNSTLVKTHRLEWQGATYSMFMPQGDSSRIFVQFREYVVDYKNPLRTAWVLKRQFEPSLLFSAQGPTTNAAVWCNWVGKLPNGSTYIALKETDPSNNVHIMELTDKGFRDVKLVVDRENGKESGKYSILKDGSLAYTYYMYNGNTTRVTKFGLTGYTNVTWKGSVYQNPVWSTTEVELGRASFETSGVNGVLSDITADEDLLIFDASKPLNSGDAYHRGAHIGIIKQGGRSYHWKSAYSVENVQGAAYPAEGRFEIGNGVLYPGSQAKSTGNFIHWQHHGEFWNSGQTNMHHLLYKNGLQLMQFGVAVGHTHNTLPKGYPGMGGNTQTIASTIVDNNLFLWQGEEGYQSGILRWKISNLNTVNEKVIPLYKSAKLEANFSFDKPNGCAPLAVNFMNESDTGSVNIASWLWDFGDGNTSTDENPSHKFTSAGSYSVSLRVTSATGDTSSFTFMDAIHVSTSPTIKIVGDTTGCVLSNVAFKSMVEASNSAELTWEWNFGNGQTSSDSFPKPQVYVDDGEYLITLSVKDAYGCSANAKTSFIALAAPKIDISPEVEICIGDLAKLNANGAEKYVWNNRSTLSCGECAAPVASPKQTTVYTVTGFNGSGCRAEASVNVNVHQPHSLSLAKNNEVCAGQSVDLVAFGADQYSWSPAADIKDPAAGVTTATPKTTTLYTVIGRDNLGCFMDTASILVTVRSTPKVNAGADLAICRGNTQQLQATGATWYQWNYTSSLSCTDCSNPVASPAMSTQFVVTGTDEFGCSGVDTVAVTVHQPFKLAVDQPADICIGQSARLAASGADQYSWSPVSGISNPSAGVTTVTPQGSTRYTVTASDKYNCFTDTASVFVKVWPYPSVETGEAKTLQVGKSLELTPVYSPDVTRYQWAPAETLNCSNCPSPFASPINETTYKITVSNNGGCQASASVTVHVICNGGNLFIPNTFSPNGDGRNDRFYVKGVGISKVKALKVYNRWGEVVYSRENMPANNENVGWDGSAKGQPLPPDVYLYTCEVVCLNNEVLTYKGDVTLLR